MSGIPKYSQAELDRQRQEQLEQERRRQAEEESRLRREAEVGANPLWLPLLVMRSPSTVLGNS